MGLNSFFFIMHMVILLVVLSLLQRIRSTRWSDGLGRAQIIIMLLYSYYFVGSVDWRFALCVAATSLLAYTFGLLIDRAKRADNQSSKPRKIAVWGGILFILILAYFKYTNFFIESINKAFGFDIGTLKIILPLGISYFTFSAISYLIDIYRGTCNAEKNLVDFVFYMAFFPKITAGPIVRWTDFKPQLKDYRGVRLEPLSTGIQIFVFGLFKKMVLADHLGVFVDDVFRTPGVFNTGTVMLSAISYSLQIYLDFSGYSDMAIGLAKILGFDFKPNFNLPYTARGFSDFWARWHISLSQWFRDYLYIPLGGSRKGEAKIYVNLMIVMLISGLWHGAGWTFILWGILQGIGCCVTRLIKERKVDCLENSIAIRALEVLVTFAFATLLWTIFRAENFEKLLIYWKALFTLHDGISQPYTWTFVSCGCVIFATIMALLKAQKNENLSMVNGFYPILDLTKTWALVVFFTLCGLIVLLGYYGKTAFIYGGF